MTSTETLGRGADAPADAPAPARAHASRAALGAIAGATSVVAFTIVHFFVISDIWWSLVPMLIAGAACGAVLAATFGLMPPHRRTTAGWFAYNAVWVVLLGALSVVSILVFEPVVTVRELIEANSGPPDELIGQALPMTAVFTVLSAAVVSRLVIGRWSAFIPVLGTAAVVVVLLGLNLSITGLAEFESGEGLLMAELFGLVVLLAGVYAVVYWIIERRA